MQIWLIWLCEKSIVFKLIKDLSFDPGLSTFGPSAERLNLGLRIWPYREESRDSYFYIRHIFA